MKDSSDNAPSYAAPGWGALFLIGVWIIAPFVLEWIHPELEKRGQLGDSYGSINALFSGLALTLIAWSVILQRKDLQATLKELRRSAEAQEKSKAALENQAAATKEQALATRRLTEVLGHSALLFREAQLAEYFRGSKVTKPAEEVRLRQGVLSSILDEINPSNPADTREEA